MFEDFVDERIDLGEVVLRVRRSPTSGTPLLLLHGHPRTAATWHKVAPIVHQAGYTVVCPDLRGYGQSSKPATTADHAPYSKRTMAADMLALMHRLGHQRFAVVGHDRGSYVALRLALDHPHAVSALAVLDSIPIAEALTRCTDRFATAWWHWFFFAQPDKPERAILTDPDAWYGDTPTHMGAAAFAEYQQAIHNPDTVRAMLEDYRAGLRIDRAHDETDQANSRRVSCPTLVLWSRHDNLEDLYGDPLQIWENWSDDLRGGHSINSGHHMAEEAPDELAKSLLTFLTQYQPSRVDTGL